MQENYAKWIQDYVQRNKGIVRGDCARATAAMAAAFPELQRVPGYVKTPATVEHWWLETPTGEVVDPTASQFDQVLEYVPWKAGDRVKVGTCMTCGADILMPVQSPNEILKIPYTCSPKCQEELVDYYV